MNLILVQLKQYPFFVFLTIFTCGIQLACDDSVISHLVSPSGTGSKVRYQFEAASTTTLKVSFPLPNDDLLNADGAIDLTQIYGDTQDRLLGKLVTQLSLAQGASLFPDIYIPFEGAISLELLKSRQRNNDIMDDIVVLMCIDEECMGERVPLDFGEDALLTGPFATLADRAIDRPKQLSRYTYPLPLLTPTRPVNELLDEQVNGARLRVSQRIEKVGEDIFNYLKTLNLDSERSLLYSNSKLFEGQLFHESDSSGRSALWTRPKIALRPNTRYAVILTADLLDSEGQSIRSPFEYVYPPSHQSTLKSVISKLDQVSLRAEGIAFMWSFTTGNPSFPLRSLMKEDHQNRVTEPFQPRISRTFKWWTPESRSRCEELNNTDCLVNEDQPALTEDIEALALSWASVNGATQATLDALEASYRSVEGIFAGRFSGWGLTETNQPYALDRDFWCILPKAGNAQNTRLDDEERSTPYPVLMWSSGGESQRLDLLLYAGHWTRLGFALCAVDEVNSIPDLPDRFVLELSTRWKETPWSSSALLSQLHVSFDESQIRPLDLPLLDDQSLQQRTTDQSLGLYQLATWLSGTGEGEIGTLRGLVNLEQSESVDPWAHRSGVFYGGEGSGAHAAVIAANLDSHTQAVALIDPSIEEASWMITALTPLGLLQGWSSWFGPWLKIAKGEDGTLFAHWAGIGHPSESAFTAPLFQIPSESGFFSLRNLNTGAEGARVPLQEGAIVSVRAIGLSQAGRTNGVDSLEPDPLAVLFYDTQAATQPRLQIDQCDQEWLGRSSGMPLVAPYTGWGVKPQSHEARSLYRWLRWIEAKLDPRVYSESMNAPPTLILSHPSAHHGSSAFAFEYAAHLQLLNQVQEDQFGTPLTIEQLALQIGVYDRWQAPSDDTPLFDLDTLIDTTSDAPILLGLPSRFLRLNVRAEQSTAGFGAHILRNSLFIEEERARLSVGLSVGDATQSPRTQFSDLNLIGHFLLSRGRGNATQLKDLPCFVIPLFQFDTCPFLTRD